MYLYIRQISSFRTRFIDDGFFWFQVRDLGYLFFSRKTVARNRLYFDKYLFIDPEECYFTNDPKELHDGTLRLFLL